jgi:hypothetical protein
MNLNHPNTELVAFDDLNVQSTGSAVNLFLQPAAKQALRMAIQDKGQQLHVNSAYRTVAQQFLLRRQFELHLCGIPAAARPGRSNHEDGLALDIQGTAQWRAVLEEHGWRWLGPTDPVHFTFMGGGTRDDIGNIGVRAFQRLWNKHNPQDRIAEDGDFGAQTAARLAISPAEGFAGARFLLLADPPLSGEDVRRVQQALVNAGIPVAVDGVFGPATKAAVEQFQQREELAVDGIVGTATLRELGLPMN